MTVVIAKVRMNEAIISNYILRVSVLIPTATDSIPYILIGTAEFKVNILRAES